MKTKVMKKSIMFISTMLIIVLGCLASMGMVQEVRAEAINVSAVADARSGSTTVVWVQAEIRDEIKPERSEERRVGKECRL